MSKPIVIFDFDGVIHSYTSGWLGTAVIPDPPVPGIREAIAEIRQTHQVVVVSSRCASPGGIEAVRLYLDGNDIEVDDVRADKPPAVAIVDDRAITFDGRPKYLLDKIQNFRPWNKERIWRGGDVVRVSEKDQKNTHALGVLARKSEFGFWHMRVYGAPGNIEDIIVYPQHLEYIGHVEDEEE